MDSMDVIHSLTGNFFFFSCWLLHIHGNESNFYLHSDIRNWIRNIEQHASDNVNKILVGNKADMDESKRVCSYPFSVFSCLWTFLVRAYLCAM